MTQRPRRWMVGLAGVLVILSAALMLTKGLAPGFARFVTWASPAQDMDLTEKGPLHVGVPPTVDAPEPFTFALTADMRIYAGPGKYDSPRFFRGAMEALAQVGERAFMVSPGDIDPPAGVYWTITDTLGADYVWYPAVGNHELPGKGEEPTRGANMDWLTHYDYGPVNPGPSGCPVTSYSFDYGLAHFAVLNAYCDVDGPTATPGDIPDHLYDWLAADLAATDRPYRFVVGHEPAYPLPDAATGRLRHVGDSLDQYPARRDRFWALLAEHQVVAYLCGHTHNYSLARIDGVWQLDAGHARGVGDQGAPSTFSLIHVDQDGVSVEAYRDAGEGYRLTNRQPLAVAVQRNYLPLIHRPWVAGYIPADNLARISESAIPSS